MPITSQNVRSKFFQDYLKSPFFESTKNIFVLWFLLVFRDALTPEFIHFITCQVDDEAHCFYIMFMWLFSKGWLEPDHQTTHGMSEEKQLEQRLKIIARSLIELIVSLFIAKHTLETWSIMYCSIVFVFFVARSFFSDLLTLPAIYFFIAYSVINFIVNAVDWVVF